MIARNYAAHYADGMAALIICGTCAVMPGVPELDAELKKLMDEGKAKDVQPEYLGRLFAGMTDRFEEPKNPNSWIANDPDVVADHAADPFNNFSAVPNIESLYAFMHLMTEITGEQWARKVPQSLPIYNIAGDQDPVGNYGQGVYEVSNWLWNTGHKVITKLYSGYRHEIHNERAIREEVVDGVIAFINGAL
jgi:alpha-beta hydrolase superfamily lysophospholipase